MGRHRKSPVTQNHHASCAPRVAHDAIPKTVARIASPFAPCRMAQLRCPCGVSAFNSAGCVRRSPECPLRHIERQRSIFLVVLSESIPPRCHVERSAVETSRLGCSAHQYSATALGQSSPRAESKPCGTPLRLRLALYGGRTCRTHYPRNHRSPTPGPSSEQACGGPGSLSAGSSPGCASRRSTRWAAPSGLAARRAAHADTPCRNTRTACRPSVSA